MHRACSRLRQRNPNLFIVESLFANGEQGAWYDPSDLNSLFQDAAGTIPVTASGDPVGLMRDKSGRGNHASQATAGSRPTFREVGGLRYLEFDGVDDFLVTAAINFVATDKMSVFVGARKTADAAPTQILVELSTTSVTNNGTFHIAAPLDTRLQFRSKGTVAGDANLLMSGALLGAADVVFTCTGDIAGDIAKISMNGGAFQATQATDQGTGNYGNYPLYIGRRGGTTLPFLGRVYGLIVRGATTTASDISSTEFYLAAKSGLTL